MPARRRLWHSNSVQPAQRPEILAELPVTSLVPFAPMLAFVYDEIAPVLPIDGRSNTRTVKRMPKTKPNPNARELSQPLTLVAEFHRAFGLPVNVMPTVSLSADLAQLRVDLLMEEVGEFADATTRKNLVEIADALADIAYVTYGAAVTYGIDLDAILAEVHRSNMSKLGPDGKPILREDGKVLKSDSYTRPDVTTVLGEQLPLPF